jgi:hypothetical protein
MIRRSSLWLLVLLPGLVSAQSSPPDAALGRLFYTPAERAALLAARRAGPAVDPNAAANAAVPVTAPVLRRLRLDGLVHRDSQPSVAFLNQRSVEDGEQILDYRLIASPRGVTLISGNGQRIRLLVGQTLLVEEGRIVDPLPPSSLSSPP